MLAISLESSEPSVEDRGELSRAGLQWHRLNILILQSERAKHLMCIRFGDTYEAARGLVRGIRSGLLSTSLAELSAREPFLLLGAFASRFVAAPLFFLPPTRGEPLSSSSSPSSSAAEESVSSADDMSEAPFRRRPLCSLWPSSWLSSLEHYKAPEIACSLGVGFPHLREVELDN